MFFYVAAATCTAIYIKSVCKQFYHTASRFLVVNKVVITLGLAYRLDNLHRASKNITLQKSTIKQNKLKSNEYSKKKKKIHCSNEWIKNAEFSHIAMRLDYINRLIIILLEGRGEGKKKLRNIMEIRIHRADRPVMIWWPELSRRIITIETFWAEAIPASFFFLKEAGFQMVNCRRLSYKPYFGYVNCIHGNFWS